jgi:hypothetical protein
MAYCPFCGKLALAYAPKNDCARADEICFGWLQNDVCDWTKNIIVCRAVCNDATLMDHCKNPLKYIQSLQAQGYSFTNFDPANCPPGTTCGFAPPGGACTSNDECASGLCKHQIVPVSKWVCAQSPLGGKCIINDDCVSGLCSNGICASNVCFSTDPPTCDSYPCGNNIFINGTTYCPAGVCEDTCVDSNYNPTTYSNTLRECSCSSPTDNCSYSYIDCSTKGSGCSCFYGKCGVVGDITGDLRVDARDIARMAMAYGSKKGPPPSGNWDPLSDFTGNQYLVPDGRVDARDIALAAKYYGKKCENPTVGATSTRVGLTLAYSSILVIIITLAIVVLIVFVAFKYFAGKK